MQFSRALSVRVAGECDVAEQRFEEGRSRNANREALRFCEIKSSATVNVVAKTRRELRSGKPFAVRSQLLGDGLQGS